MRIGCASRRVCVMLCVTPSATASARAAAAVRRMREAPEPEGAPPVFEDYDFERSTSMCAQCVVCVSVCASPARPGVRVG